jgi:hypothetical protein
MQLHKFEQSHYEMLVGWWKEHGHPIVAFETLSPIGVIVEKDGTFLAASFIYVMHGCDLAQIAWTTTNPEGSLKDNYKAVDECITGLLDIVKLNKRKHVICFSSSTGLTRMIKSHGFNVGTTHEVLMGYFHEDKI